MVYTKRSNSQTCDIKDISPVRNTNWSQAPTGSSTELKLSSSPNIGYKLEVPQMKQTTFQTSGFGTTKNTNTKNTNTNNNNNNNNNKWFYNEMVRNDRDKFNSLHFA